MNAADPPGGEKDGVRLGCISMHGAPSIALATKPRLERHLTRSSCVDRPSAMADSAVRTPLPNRRVAHCLGPIFVACLPVAAKRHLQNIFGIMFAKYN